jgi:hypothetical protein
MSKATCPPLSLQIFLFSGKIALVLRDQHHTDTNQHPDVDYLGLTNASKTEADHHRLPFFRRCSHCRWHRTSNVARRRLHREDKELLHNIRLLCHRI